MHALNRSIKWRPSPSGCCIALRCARSSFDGTSHVCDEPQPEPQPRSQDTNTSLRAGRPKEQQEQPIAHPMPCSVVHAKSLPPDVPFFGHRFYRRLADRILRLLSTSPAQAADISTAMCQVSSNVKQTSKARAKAAAVKLTIVILWRKEKVCWKGWVSIRRWTA